MKKEHMSGFTKEHMHDITTGEGLEVGSKHPAHKDGLKANGSSQGVESVETGEGNQETRRHGSKPKPGAVSTHATEDPKCLANARKYAARSEHGGAEPTAASQKVSE